MLVSISGPFLKSFGCINKQQKPGHFTCIFVEDFSKYFSTKVMALILSASISTQIFANFSLHYNFFYFDWHMCHVCSPVIGWIPFRALSKKYKFFFHFFPLTWEQCNQEVMQQNNWLEISLISLAVSDEWHLNLGADNSWFYFLHLIWLQLLGI